MTGLAGAQVNAGAPAGLSFAGGSYPSPPGSYASSKPVVPQDFRIG